MNLSICHWHAASSLKWSQNTAIFIYQSKKFQQVSSNFHYFSFSLPLILKIYEITLKTNDRQKVQSWFSNISARKYPSKMVQYSIWTFICQVSNETDPNHGGFWFLEKSGKNHGAIFLKHFKRLHHGVSLSFQKIKSLIWNLTSKGPFWVLNHFWGIFAG